MVRDLQTAQQDVLSAEEEGGQPRQRHLRGTWSRFRDRQVEIGLTKTVNRVTGVRLDSRSGLLDEQSSSTRHPRRHDCFVFTSSSVSLVKLFRRSMGRQRRRTRTGGFFWSRLDPWRLVPSMICSCAGRLSLFRSRLKRAARLKLTETHDSKVEVGTQTARIRSLL